MGTNKLLIRIGVVLGAILLFTSTVPALLSASSDLAVLLGVFIIIGSIVIIYKNFEKIINWFKLN